MWGTHPRDCEAIRQRRVPISLVEKIGQQMETNWLYSNKGPHLSELVIPLVKNAKHHTSKPIQPPAYESSYDKVRWKPPGSEWFYIKLFVPEDAQDRFLTDHLEPLIEQMQKPESIRKMVFCSLHRPRFSPKSAYKGSTRVCIPYDHASHSS